MKYTSLKGEKKIQKLFQEGKSLFHYPIKCFYLIETIEGTTDGLLLNGGVTVSKRNVKKAVDRNKVKRQMRAALQAYCTNSATEEHNQTIIIESMYLCVAKEKQSYEMIKKAIFRINKKMLGL